MPSHEVCVDFRARALLRAGERERQCGKQPRRQARADPRAAGPDRRRCAVCAIADSTDGPATPRRPAGAAPDDGPSEAANDPGPAAAGAAAPGHRAARAASRRAAPRRAASRAPRSPCRLHPAPAPISMRRRGCVRPSVAGYIGVRESSSASWSRFTRRYSGCTISRPERTPSHFAVATQPQAARQRVVLRLAEVEKTQGQEPGAIADPAQQLATPAVGHLGELDLAFHHRVLTGPQRAQRHDRGCGPRSGWAAGTADPAPG